jgi:hypothetical protein
MAFNVRQKSFRGRIDNQVLNAASWDYGLNTVWTWTTGTFYRVRFSLQEYGTTAGTTTWSLMYRRNSGTFATVSSSSPWIRLATSSQFANLTAATVKLLDGIGTWRNGAGLTTSQYTATHQMASLGHTEFEFGLKAIGSWVGGDTMNLRVYQSGTRVALTGYLGTGTWTMAQPCNGTTSETLGDITRSSAGKVYVAGTFSQTLSAITRSISGTITNPPSGALVQYRALLDAYGSVVLDSNSATVYTREWNYQLSDVGRTLTGKVTTHGTFNKTLANITRSIAGNIQNPAIHGILSKNLDAITRSSAGKVIAKGSTSKTLATVTRSSSGKVIVKGSTSKTLDSVTRNSAGKVTVKGSTSKTLSTITKTITGKVAVKGSLGKTLGAIAPSISGIVFTPIPGITGSLAKTLSGITSASSGKIIVSGTFSKSLSTVTKTLSGRVTVNGSFAKSLAGIGRSSSGTVKNAIHGTTAKTLANITRSSAGKVYVKGNSAKSLASLGRTISGKLPIKGTGLKTFSSLTGTGTGRVYVKGGAQKGLDGITLYGRAHVPMLGINGSLGKQLGGVVLYSVGSPITGGGTPDNTLVEGGRSSISRDISPNIHGNDREIVFGNPTSIVKGRAHAPVRRSEG